MDLNKQLRLRQRPSALAGPEHFDLVSIPKRMPAPGEVLLKTLYLSIDPAMRVWLSAAPGYVEPVAIGEVMRGACIAQVRHSADDRFVEGDFVQARTGWQTHPTVPADGIQKIDLTLGSLQDWIGPLGSTGLTAYFGLLRVGALIEGETVLVSAASGAVGQMVGQIARLHGATTIGIAGGAEKCRLARDEHGFDKVLDYKSDVPIAQQLDRDIDIYFDNVGGAILDAALARMAARARVVVCGRISQTAASHLYGVKNIGLLIGRRARMEGFIVSDYASEYAQAREWIAARVRAGELHQRLHVLDGFEQCPSGLAMLFSGANTGKLVVKP